MNQEMYLQFQKQYELARIEELDDQNLIQVVKNPEVPVSRAKPNRKVVMTIALVCGFILGSIFAALVYAYPIIFKRSVNSCV